MEEFDAEGSSISLKYTHLTDDPIMKIIGNHIFLPPGGGGTQEPPKELFVSSKGMGGESRVEILGFLEGTENTQNCGCNFCMARGGAKSQLMKCKLDRKQFIEDTKCLTHHQKNGEQLT